MLLIAIPQHPQVFLLCDEANPLAPATQHRPYWLQVEPYAGEVIRCGLFLALVEGLHQAYFAKVEQVDEERRKNGEVVLWRVGLEKEVNEVDEHGEGLAIVPSVGLV